jgi:hypothetical protein
MSSEELKRFEQFEEDMLWIEREFDNLQARYPDEFIAVYRSKVIAHGADHSKVIAQTRAVAATDVSEIAIKFIPADEFAVVL